MIITQYNKTTPFITKDGSVIRELMHPSIHGNKKQSLAEAVVPSGKKTLLHKHHVSEELYMITSGSGIMTLGDESREVSIGDVILIPPGTPHDLYNPGDEDLILLCCCSPAYSHADTQILETVEPD